jgi:hypothetical protein
MYLHILLPALRLSAFVALSSPRSTEDGVALLMLGVGVLDGEEDWWLLLPWDGFMLHPFEVRGAGDGGRA